MMYIETMGFKGDLEALILGVLRTEALHGYEISKRIKGLSDKALSYGEGQLYPTLHRLETERAIEASWVPQEGGRPPRKVYNLTDEGRKQLEARQKEWRAFEQGVINILFGKQEPA
jgi:PadR family transcriptional regulator PadR